MSVKIFIVVLILLCVHHSYSQSVKSEIIIHYNGPTMGPFTALIIKSAPNTGYPRTGINSSDEEDHIVIIDPGSFSSIYDFLQKIEPPREDARNTSQYFTISLMKERKSVIYLPAFRTVRCLEDLKKSLLINSNKKNFEEVILELDKLIALVGM